MKKLFLLTSILAVLASVAFGAGSEFDGITDVLKSGDTAGKAGLGMGLAWTFSLLVPGCMVGGAMLGYTFAKKKAEQQQEGQTKMPVIVAAMIIVGAFVAILVTALFGQILLGDSGALFEAVYKFYRESLGL